MPGVMRYSPLCRGWPSRLKRQYRRSQKASSSVPSASRRLKVPVGVAPGGTSSSCSCVRLSGWSSAELSFQALAPSSNPASTRPVSSSTKNLRFTNQTSNRVRAMPCSLRVSGPTGQLRSANARTGQMPYTLLQRKSSSACCNCARLMSVT